MSLASHLATGLDKLGLTLDVETQQRLLDYVALLHKWNKVYNLTAVREPQRMIYHHLLDSLVVFPHMAGRNIADVGSGAGLPGIPLALANPEWKITLLDSNHKKTVFLQQVCIELGLANVTVVCDRVEAWRPAEKFDVVISRAFSDLGELARLTAHLCAADGVLMAMKGLYPNEELAQLSAEFVAEPIIPLQVPGLEAHRHLVTIKRSVQ